VKAVPVGAAWLALQHDPDHRRHQPPQPSPAEPSGSRAESDSADKGDKGDKFAHDREMAASKAEADRIRREHECDMMRRKEELQIARQRMMMQQMEIKQSQTVFDSLIKMSQRHIGG